MNAVKGKGYRPQNPYINSQYQELSANQAATPNTNPLRPYTKIVEVMHHHEMKEEAQQVNFDDLSLGSAIQMSTPSDNILAGGQALRRETSEKLGSQPYKNVQEHRGLNTSQEQYEFSTQYHSQPHRSQTAASQYVVQSRNLQMGASYTSANNHPEQPMMRKTATDFTKVKMTRSVYRQHQQKIFQEVGVSFNVRPLTRQSGMGKLVLRHGGPFRNSTSEFQSESHPQRQLTSQAAQHQQFANIIKNSRNLGGGAHKTVAEQLMVTQQASSSLNQTHQSVKKGKDGCYISFQTNVDNTQAIIPMILSNDDLLGTNAEDVMNVTGSSSDDLKKTLMSRQANPTHITVDNQAVPGPQMTDTRKTWTKQYVERNGNHQIFQNIYQNASSEDQTNPASRRMGPNNNNLSDMQMTETSFINIVPNYATSARANNSVLRGKTTEATQRSRNPQFARRQGKSQQQASRAGTQMAQDYNASNNYQAIQQVKNFGFQSIPDFKEHKIRALQDQHMKNVSKQSQAEGRVPDVNEYSFTTGTSFFQQPQPLFLSSTKKAPGLQKECAGSYANVINNRTCLGQKNVFKFSMDLPLKLKQQMWLQHQQEKEQITTQFQQSDPMNLDVNKAQAQTSTANFNVQSTLEIVGITSRLHLDKSMGVLMQNNFASGTHINLDPHTWSQSNRESHNPAVVTAELSKQEIISPYRDSKALDKINESTKQYAISHVKLVGMMESGTSSHEISSDNLSQASKLKRPQAQVESLLESPTNKRSKIIYSINKSTRNKNSPSRSRNFLYQNESQVNFKKSQDSKRSKKSTISKHLGSHYVEQNILDSAFLSSIGPLPEIFPYQDEGKDGVQVPIIRSQESSFHVSRKRGPPRRSDFINDDLHGNIIQPENPGAHDFNMTQISIKVDSKRSNTIYSSKKSNSKNILYHLVGKLGRHGSATSNQVRRGEEALARELKIQRLQIHKMRDSQQRNETHIKLEEGPSIESVRQQEISQPHARYESVRAKMVESRTQQLRLRSRSSRSLHETYQPHAQKVLTLIASLHGSLLPKNHADEPPIAQAYTDEQPIAINIQEVQNEVKRQDSAFTQGSEGASSSFEALHLQLMKRDPPAQRQDIQEVPINETILMDIDQELQDQLPSRKSFKQVLSKHHARPTVTEQGTLLDPSPSFQRLQTEQFILSSPTKQPPLFETRDLQDGGVGHNMRPSTSQINLVHGGSMASIVVGQVDITSPQLIQQQIDEAVFGNQNDSNSPDQEGGAGKRIEIDDVDRLREPKTEVKQTIENGLDQNKMSVSQYKDSSIMDEGDRYQMQAAIMEKVVVKSPGRETTDHVKTGGAPQPFSLSSLITEVPITQHLHQKKSSLHRRPSNRGRRLSQDLQDVNAASDHVSQSPKRTVLIKKSRGANEISELMVQNQEASDKVASKVDTTVVKKRPSIIIKRGHPVNPTQMFSLEELGDQEFVKILNQSNNALPISDPRRDMPRHGTAAPSVIRRNKETMRRKKGSQPTQQRQSNSQESHKISSKDIFAATFHVMPAVITQNQNQGDQPSNMRKSKTPNGQTVYQHTSKMQTLVIHQSELAIDSSLQKMQLQLIQAYHDHYNRMHELNPDLPHLGPDHRQQIGVLRVVPVILQNQARLPSQQQPAIPVTVTGVPQPRIFDSFDDVSSLAALHKIIEETKSKDSSKNNTVLMAPHVGDSVSHSKLNGWRESKDHGIAPSDQNSISENPMLRDSLGSRTQVPVNPKSIKERRNSRNRNIQSLHRAKTSQRSQIATNRLNEEAILTIVGKNMKN